MSLRTALVLALFVFTWCYNGVEGKRRLSREEDLELEKELQRLNKPAIKSIRTKYGDIYNCIDFYKQPAFDHPSLKNYTFDFKIKLEEKRNGDDQETMSFLKPSNIWLNGKGCPHGTVPIRKFTKDDLIRSKLATQIYASKLSPLAAGNPGVHYAVLHTKADTNFQYNGGGMVASLQNPKVEGSQYSSVHVKVQNGPDSVEVGWMVNPTLYKDNHTRLFVYTNAGESHCFNTYCPAIIPVRSDIPLDARFGQTSERGGELYLQQFFIYRDASNGNWYLAIGKESEIIGFWPKNRFTSLTDFATYVEWGGEAYSPPGVPSPPMGFGTAIVGNGNAGWDAFCSSITVVNKGHQIVDAIDTQEYIDVNTYELKDRGYANAYLRHIFFYGGLGGYTGGN